MANKIRYQCSNCGQHGVAIPFPSIPESMFFEGFRAHGDVLYCPDCVKTWKERNGMEYDEQYKEPPHLFAMWWNRQVQTHWTLINMVAGEYHINIDRLYHEHCKKLRRKGYVKEG